MLQEHKFPTRPLLQCPFCNGHAERVVQHPHPDFNAYLTIQCKRCGARGPLEMHWETRDPEEFAGRVADGWNRRYAQGDYTLVGYVGHDLVGNPTAVSLSAWALRSGTPLYVTAADGPPRG